ncbi:MAG: AAA domain-containing protein [Hydrogenoanaerobacterium sp.]
MNQQHNLILANGQDKTADIRSCSYNTVTKKYDIIFRSGKKYEYNYSSIEWVRNPDNVDPTLVHISHKERELFNIQSIVAFHARNGDYWHIHFKDGSGRTYEKQSLKIDVSCLGEQQSNNCFDYLCKLASINELKSDDGTILLAKQYEKLPFVSQKSAMAAYLSPNDYHATMREKSTPIFPFGGNASQFHAVAAALENQISVIQGPPGTGKTQTILNIIANLLANGKTVLVVSNNNSATENVLEKLSNSKNSLGFLVAPLGKAENKAAFLEKQTGLYPALSEWKQTFDRQTELKNSVTALSAQLSELFIKQERLAVAKQELNALVIEMKYFTEYCTETGIDNAKVKPRKNLKAQTLMQLWQECCAFSDQECKITLWFKLKSILLYGISDWEFYKNSLPRVITMLQGLYYQAKKSELEDKIASIEKLLIEQDTSYKMDELTKLSTRFLHAVLSARYAETQSRRKFTEDDLWQRSMEVLQEYPIVLSTTFSSISSLKNATYDYIIMDEASQVDVATGALALSCAKNAVIVGDLKQLPNVVNPEMKRRSDAVLSAFNLPDGYSFSENSFLKSICSVLPNIPQTLLREHYRCHPKIIGFCNQKFYQNELIVMTEDHGDPDVLKIFQTNEGSHLRDHTNQRQIDVTLQEVLPRLKNVLPTEIGIISPYKDQVGTIKKELGDSEIEAHTVHKFQGREKDAIILTTVDDVVTNFSDDPYLLNVAVSRAKKQLALVVSGNEQPVDSNIGDLISYIRYNNCEVVQSEIYSIFDLLYSQYTDARIAYLRKHKQVSEYDSENLMYAAICDLLDKRPYLLLGVICHQPLNMLIRDPHLLNDSECRYAMNTATHLDFLIYHRIRKIPVLAIEVDGFHFHKQGTAQYERDRMKDHILKLYNIPLLRFATNGSSEINIIAQALDAYVKVK